MFGFWMVRSIAIELCWNGPFQFRTILNQNNKMFGFGMDSVFECSEFEPPLYSQHVSLLTYFRKSKIVQVWRKDESFRTRPRWSRSLFHSWKQKLKVVIAGRVHNRNQSAEKTKECPLLDQCGDCVIFFRTSVGRCETLVLLFFYILGTRTCQLSSIDQKFQVSPCFCAD